MTMVNVVPIRIRGLKAREEDVTINWRLVLDARFELSRAEDKRREAGRARSAAIDAYNEAVLKSLLKHWEKLGLGWCTRCNKVARLDSLELVYIVEMRVISHSDQPAQNGLYRKHREILFACRYCREQMLPRTCNEVVPVIRDPADDELKYVEPGRHGETVLRKVWRNEIDWHVRFTLEDLARRSNASTLAKWGVEGAMRWDAEHHRVTIGNRVIEEDVLYEDGS